MNVSVENIGTPVNLVKPRRAWLVERATELSKGINTLLLYHAQDECALEDCRKYSTELKEVLYDIDQCDR